MCCSWQSARPGQHVRASEQAQDRLSPEKIHVTSKSPVGDISVVTLIRTDTTLDHSQKAEKVWGQMAFRRAPTSQVNDREPWPPPPQQNATTSDTLSYTAEFPATRTSKQLNFPATRKSQPHQTQFRQQVKFPATRKSQQVKPTQRCLRSCA